MKQRDVICGRSDCPKRGILRDIPPELLAAYRAGDYSMPVPPVCTALWNENDWIRWIHDHGEWHGITVDATP
jgi:hypothetical protein